jgi:hypothetical protein
VRRAGVEYHVTAPFNDLLREAAPATLLPPMPLVVLASGWPWPGTAEGFSATWRMVWEELATILPHARFVASESGHDLHALAWWRWPVPGMW